MIRSRFQVQNKENHVRQKGGLYGKTNDKREKKQKLSNLQQENWTDVQEEPKSSDAQLAVVIEQKRTFK